MHLSVRKLPAPIARSLAGWWPLLVFRHMVQAFHHPLNRGRRIRAALGFLAFAIRSRGGHLVEVPAGFSSRLLAGVHETNSRRAAVARLPDLESMKVWLERLGPRDLFIDVGANIGMYTVIVGETGADIVACEPVSSLAHRVRENVALNGRTADVVVAAVSAEPGEMAMTTSLDSYNHLSFGEEESTTEIVPVTTLDEVLGDRTADGVKIDVQGAERLVLEGASTALSEQRIRVLQIEWNQWSRHLLGEPRSATADLLRRHGYELYRADSTGMLFPAAGDEAEGARDMFAMPARG
jgi:FkbM family methyltransferase